MAYQFEDNIFPSARDVFHSAPIEDSSLQALRQPWVEIDCYQLSRGRKVAQLDSLNLGSQQIVRERQDASVQKLGVTPTDFCTISICTQQPTTRFSQHCGEQDDTIFFMPENVEFDIHIPAGGETAYVGFSQEEFLRSTQVLNPRFWDNPPQSVVPLTTHHRGEFKNAVDLWLKTAHEASKRGETLNVSLMQNHLLQAVLQIIDVPENNDTPSFNERARAMHIGRSARDFVDECMDLDQLPSVVDICAALNVSERALQYAFQAYVGLSPLAYLRICRLNHARAALRGADPHVTTITQVAMRFGFWHLGRFSGDYKKMFGETPSATFAS